MWEKWKNTFDYYFDFHGLSILRDLAVMDEPVCSRCLGYLNFIFEFLEEEKPVVEDARLLRKLKLESKQQTVLLPPKIDSIGCSPMKYFRRKEKSKDNMPI